jgi:hypothetical protein
MQENRASRPGAPVGLADPTIFRPLVTATPHTTRAKSAAGSP